jgi:hypothetical protein
LDHKGIAYSQQRSQVRRALATLESTYRGAIKRRGD